MSGLKLYLFGTPQLEVEGKTAKIERRKAMAIIAYLALTPQPQSRDILATLLWQESSHNKARAALRSALNALTKIVDTAWIEADRTNIALNPDAIWIDTVAFKTLIKTANAHHHDQNALCDACLQAYTDAIELYQAEFMHGFYINNSSEFEEWQTQQRAWFHREYSDIQRRLTLHYATQQQFEQALKHAQQWLAADPLQEIAHRQLMSLYAVNGQRSEVHRQYKQCVALMDEAFVTPPEPETTALYENLVRSSTSISSSGATGYSSVGVIPPLPALIVGREQALKEIKGRLGIGDPDTAHPFTVIHGWPGVGKSTLSAMLSHDTEISAHFPDGILWASLGETPDLLSELSGWATALGLPDSSQTRTIEDISTRIGALVRDKRLLMIIDDVWQIEHVKLFRVGGQHCVTVMTSRLFDVALALAPTATDIYRLPVLSEADSFKLLAMLTPETVTAYPDESRQLVNDVEGLPLAIHVAGRLLHNESAMGWGIQDLLNELHAGTALLTAQPPSDVLVVGRDASPTVTALLKRSTNRLDPQMRLLFALLSLFVPKPATFDIQAIAVAWDVLDPRPAIRVLVNHGLLEPVSGGRFQMHALLVLHAKSLLQTEFGG
ncbi:MAG: NB-ARC domain-containing protein [Aggregatilineales bacterium]